MLAIPPVISDFSAVSRRIYLKRRESCSPLPQTSALDYLTESKLLTAIHEQLSDTTLILISQRTNSLKAADKILLLDKGHQLGFASHDELLASNELYRDIHYSQHQKGKED